MGNLEEKFCKKEPHRPDFWKRFIDNILCVWTGSRESLEALLPPNHSLHLGHLGGLGILGHQDI